MYSNTNYNATNYDHHQSLYDNYTENHLHPHILISDAASSCQCDEIQNSVLDIRTIPTIWNDDHDDMLRYMLSRWMIPMDLFHTFKAYIHIDGTAVSKPKYV